ncbi:MAG: hypothetical protein N2545_06405 [Thermoflexales bacterium]|nr:hypothetical protein [Thermoflexales bacterium]
MNHFNRVFASSPTMLSLTKRIFIGSLVLAFALSACGSDTAPEQPTKAVVQVTIFAPQPTAMPPVAPPAPQQPSPAQPTSPAPAMDPRGRVAGIPDFVCPNPRPAPEGFNFGIQSNWSVGDIGYWNSIMAEQLKLTWTRAKVNWYEFEPERGKPNLTQFQLFDAFVADANKKGLHIVATITQPPQWTRVTPPKQPHHRPSPPEDINEGIRFFGLIAARYKGCIQAIEVLNETNLDREWTVASGELKASDYVSFLRSVVPVMRQIDPALIIIMAAPSPTGLNMPGVAQDDFLYLEDFVRAGGLDYVDCIGVHLNGYNMPPDKRWDEGYNDPTARFRGPFDNPHHSWSLLSTIEGYRQRTNKPMCVTEFGWATIENLKRADGTPVQNAPPGFDFALDNTEEEQAEWIMRSLDIFRELGYVRLATIFNLDYIQKIGKNPDEPGGDPGLYSIIRQDGSPRPAFERLRDRAR